VLLIWLSCLSHVFIFCWFYFVSLYIWLYVLYAFVQFCKLCILIVMICILIDMFMYSYYVCMFCFGYSVSLCFVYWLCVNVYCTTATGCQPNCSKHIICYHYNPFAYQRLYSFLNNLNILHDISNSTYLVCCLFGGTFGCFTEIPADT
jgi:hypothetical protein